MLKVSIAGASGYVGGELLRILLRHPEFEVASVTSERHAGTWVHQLHPHLRGVTEARFVPLEQIEPADVLILALPHGEVAGRLAHFEGLADFILDCSADFRLDDPMRYAAAYGKEHPCPDRLADFVYGLPEMHRERLRGARRVSGVGCNATAVQLALLPLARAGLIGTADHVVVDVKAGSSQAGRAASLAGAHAERSGIVRSFAPTGHRHAAEVEQSFGFERLHLSVTAVDMVRGALATAHVFPTEPVDDKRMWQVYREAVAEQPFLRVVHERRGHHRHPDPKTLVGTNHADVGWSVDEERGRVVALCAIDNLGKGAAGSAVQCLNLMCGFDERSGLDLPAIWPL